MKLEQKLQRNRPYFPGRAEALKPLWSNNWWHRMVCVGSGDGPWRWMSGAHLPGSCTCGGQRRGGRQCLWAPGGGAVQLPESWIWWAGCRWGRWVLWLWGWASRPPVCWGLHRRAPKPPGLRYFSQNPVFTLPASELLLFVCFFFLSQTVVPKIANLRNHREANTNANTRGFIYKLELVSKYTRQSGAGTWTPRWVLAYF